MLEELVVDGLGAIDHAEIGLGAGLSALTGETGAGKTLLVAALGLLLGERSDRSRVREGASETVVEGRFTVPADHPALGKLIDQEIIHASEEDVEIVLHRSIPADGRAARARINGRLVTTAVLSSIGSSLVEIAGQNQHQLLAGAATQRFLLDNFIGPRAIELSYRVRRAVRAALEAARELEKVEAGERERERRMDVLRFEVQEIEAIAPESGEADRLKTQAVRLEHASSIAAALGSARGCLKSEGGAVDLATGALDHLQEAAAIDPALDEVHQRLDSTIIDLADIAETLGSFDLDADPGTLERLRDRVGELSRLTRKYGVDEDAVISYLDAARAELADLEETTGSLEALQQKMTESRAVAASLAAQLSDEREAGARSLEEAMEPQLAELALAGARFEVALESCDLYEGGAEKVEFLVAANPGEAPKSIGKVASGGELSRIALALHVLSGTGTTPTLVFDEVDAGVGGQAAQAVGRALARLAKERAAQVIVVTHLPQVASWANSHYVVAKEQVKGRSSVAVQRAEGDHRIEELSRMLAGLPESDRARQHAEELLEIAGRPR